MPTQERPSIGSSIELEKSIRDSQSTCADGAHDEHGETKRIGRPPKSTQEKYKPTYIRFHPKIVEWAKAEADRRGVGYQSVINETLLEHVG